MRTCFICIAWLLMAQVQPVVAQVGSNDILSWLEQNGCRPSIRFLQHDAAFFSRVVKSEQFLLSPNTPLDLPVHSGRWQVHLQANRVPGRQDAVDMVLTCQLAAGTAPQTSVAVDLTFHQWSASNYVLMPGAAYNGNRFESRRIRYSPKLLDSRDIGPDKPAFISDVPRLNIHDGPSFIQERSGAMTLPAIGFHSDSSGRGFLLVTDQGTPWGDHGFRIEESRDRKKAVISLVVPVVREQYQYHITNNQAASTDRAPDFIAGDAFTLRFRVYGFPSNRIQDLFDQFALARNALANVSPLKPFIPFSSCFEVQEKKFNQQNWVEPHGYYSVGMRENFLQDWQIGWTGGMISTYPLLLAGNDSSRRHVMRNFDWLFPNGISPSGFFWDSGEKGTKWYGGDIRKPQSTHWHLVRKSGDGLYYILKQFMLMRRMRWEVKPHWETGTRGVADAFLRVWKQWGQLGNFVDSRTGDIAVGGSTSGAIVPAALVLASQYFRDSSYMEAAVAMADSFYARYVRQGITCGGPGDAMQNPDSESSYAMLESFMLLYEATNDPKWLTRAEEMAVQFSTWVMAYDYQFPVHSTLGKLGVSTRGVVFANTQNKHGAPGICTYSGVALWRLYRATGKAWYMELLRDITFVMPQYLSHPDRPIEGMPPGWMSERVSTTDWLEGIGELMYGSTWSETALMLGYVELPGVYVRTDKSLVCAIDNVEARLVSETSTSLTIQVSNPTRQKAKLKLVVENSLQAAKPLGENALYGTPILELLPGESRKIKIGKK